MPVFKAEEFEAYLPFSNPLKHTGDLEFVVLLEEFLQMNGCLMETPPHPSNVTLVEAKPTGPDTSSSL